MGVQRKKSSPQKRERYALLERGDLQKDQRFAWWKDETVVHISYVCISAITTSSSRCLSGGAPLSQKTQEFINVVFGIPVLQGFRLASYT
jgi:long-subunit acyl-CoA synthetase (AMP-forming)